jgi:hypothetical protein
LREGEEVVEEGEGGECVEREGRDPLGEERRGGVVVGSGNAHGGGGGMGSV